MFRRSWRASSTRSKVLFWTVLAAAGVALVILGFKHGSGLDSPTLEGLTDVLDGVVLAGLIAQGISLQLDARRRRRAR